MKYKEDLEAEFKNLKAELPLILDEKVDSPVVRVWVEKVLKVKENLSKKVH